MNEPKNDLAGTVKELVAALISVAILAASVFILISTFVHAGQKSNTGVEQEQYARMRDLVTVAIGLLGTVTGYYLGRIPAEKRADAAEKAAGTADKRAQEAETKRDAATSEVAKQRSDAEAAKRDALSTLDGVDDLLSSLSQDGKAGLLSGAPGAPVPDADALRQRVHDLRRKWTSPG